MGSERAGMIFGALAQGAGLFAASQLEKEREEADRKWQMALEEARMAREDAREGRTIEREAGRESRAVERDRIRTEAETTRHTETQSARERQHRETIGASGRAADAEDVRRREESLDKILADIEERRAEVMKNPMNMDQTKEGLEAVNAPFDREASYAIQAHVARLSSMGAKGYEVDSVEDLKAVLMRNRMPVKMADDVAKGLWSTIGDGTELFKDPETTGFSPDKTVDSTGQRIVASDDPINTTYSPAPMQQPARQVDAVQPESAAGSVPPQAGGGVTGLLYSEDWRPATNPDGTPKYPGKSTPLTRGASKLWDFLNTPTPYSD